MALAGDLGAEASPANRPPSRSPVLRRRKRPRSPEEPSPPAPEAEVVDSSSPAGDPEGEEALREQEKDHERELEELEALGGYPSDFVCPE